MKYTIVSIDDTRETYKQSIRSFLGGWEEVTLKGVNGNINSELETALDRHGRPVINREMKVGQLGRWLSYLDQLDIISNEPLFVVEDDAVLAPDFVARIEPLLRDTPNDADFFSLFIPRNRPAPVYLGGNSINPLYYIGHKTIVRAHQPYGGVAMFLYPGMRDKVLADLNERGICGQFDDELYILSSAGKVNGYSIVPDMPDLVWITGDVPSTVHETKWYGQEETLA